LITALVDGLIIEPIIKCRWLATDEAKTSGPTTLEVETPSGYGFVQSDANELVIKNNYTFIRDVFIGRSKIIWVFDRVMNTISPRNQLTNNNFEMIRLARSGFVLNIMSIVGFPLPI
jgi:hypothetical protein